MLKEWQFRIPAAPVQAAGCLFQPLSPQRLRRSCQTRPRHTHSTCALCRQRHSGYASHRSICRQHHPPSKLTVRRSSHSAGPLSQNEEDILAQSAEAPRPSLQEQEQPVASTSDREQENDFADLDPKLTRYMAMIPFAAFSIGSYNFTLKDLTARKLAKAWKRFTDTVNFSEILPPVGSQQLSYAKFLELLSTRRIKRIILMDNGTCAIVEIPVEGYAASYKVPLSIDHLDETIQFAGAPTDEWDMEKIRYYVELPGDIFEDGYFMDLVKVNMGPLRDEEGRMPHQYMLESDQTYLELQVVDHSDANIFLEAMQGQLLPIFALVFLRFIVFVLNWALKFFDKEKTELQDMIDEYSKFRGTLYNVEGGKTGTGVRYEDVAGVEHAMELVEETVEMLLGDKRYREMGAKPPRGILMDGPPGTGKTFLAKAMAGESGLPFISTNGSEFVEMFEGVAAARVRDLFMTARKIAPAIIFIDEIDAIGKARGEGGGGSNERESGLMQILYEMDGFTQGDQILVIGATNRRDALDDALLRPGRFDRTIHMGLPATNQRFKILQVHARNKAVPREGDAFWPEDALLHRTAELTIGYSGAELANLLNEAAILMVRKDMKQINLALIREVLDKRVIGTAGTCLPDSVAKRRLAVVSAARAVVVALTPGLPPLQRMSIVPRGENMTRTLFMPQDSTTLPHLWQPGKFNAVEVTEPLSPYEMMTGLLVPLYAARVAEEAYYGRGGVTLSTSREVAEAGQLAHYLVVKSSLFPAYRNLAISHDLVIGDKDDPTTANLSPEYEYYILNLQRAAHAKALRIVKERRAAVEAVAQEMCDSEDDTILGHRIVEIIEAAPVDVTRNNTEAGTSGAALFSADGAGRVGAVSFAPLRPVAVPASSRAATAACLSFSGTGAGRVGQARFGGNAVDLHVISTESLVAAVDAVVGRVDMAELTGVGVWRRDLEEARAKLESKYWAERVKGVRKYARSAEPDVEFPLPPPVPDYEGDLLEDWVNPLAREPILT